MQIARNRVFIHHDGALGDVLLSLSCLKSVRSAADFVHLACEHAIGEFLQQAGFADEVSRVDSILYSPLYAQLPSDWSCGLLSSCDLAYLFTAGESAIGQNLKQCIPDVRIIRTIPPAGATEHAAHFRLRQFGYDTDMPDSGVLSIPELSRNWAKELLAHQGFQKGRDRLLIVHPGSGGTRKCWPLGHYLDLIKSISENPLIWCGVLSGPAEPLETVRALHQLEADRTRVIHLHQEPLSHIAALLSIADHYLGNDSGISHLAGAMRCRGTVLFGPTDPQIWRPFYEGIETVRFTQNGDSDQATVSGLSERILSEMGSNKRQ